MKTITIFTPTFNRAYCLINLYNSLCIQTCNDFEWLIIDDGSTDGTEKLVESWIKEEKVHIRYMWKKNGGMHTGHNVALDNIHTDLNVCIDSDDYMTETAVNDILIHWNLYGNDDFAGILALDAYSDGKIVSSKKFPEGVHSGKYCRLKTDYGLIGDIKFIYKTSIIKKYPKYPVFENENFTPLGYIYRLIDQDFDMLFLNKVVCIVEYMEDGSTKNIIKQYFNNPNGFRYSRLVTMKYSYSLRDKIMQSSHFIAESIISKKFNLFKGNEEKLITFFSIPMGILMYLYLCFKLKFK